MRLIKKKGRIHSEKHSPLFRHCSGGFNSVHEKEYPEVEKVLFAHNVNIVHVQDEADVKEEETDFDVSQIGDNF